MNETEKQEAKQEAAEEGFSPIVIDMGKVRSKRIKQLREGKGPLVQNVADALFNVHQQLKGNLAHKKLVPVVLVYRKKLKKTGRRTLFNPFGL
jgi:hypothetical protein